MASRYFCFYIFLLLETIGYGQNITGKIIDEKNTPLELANVVLFSKTDSSFISGTTSSSDGSFIIQVPPKDKELIMKISFIGYKSCWIEQLKENMGTILLTTDNAEMEEVVIKATKKIYKMTTGGIIADVENSLLKDLGTANHLLSRLPGVQGGNGNFSVFGKGTPLIFINGKQIRDNLELERLLARDIKEVEIITNPGVEYNASVKAVIRIKTKTKLGDGFSMYARNVMTQSKRFGNRTILYGAYRKGKLDIWSFLFYRNEHNNQKQRESQIIKTDTQWNLSSSLDMHTQLSDYSITGGLNYIFNEKHSAGITYKLSEDVNAYGGFEGSMSVTANKNYKLDELNYTMKKDYIPRPTHLITTYYRGEFGKWNFNLDTDFYFSRNKSQEVTQEQSELQQNRTVSSENKRRADFYASRLVFGHSLGKGNIQLGSEFSSTNSHSIYESYWDMIDSTNDLVKTRNIATFCDFQHTFKDFQVQAGLRYEYQKSTYYEKDVKKKEYSPTYNHIFPNLNITYFSKEAQVQLGYSKSIQRPTYAMLNSNIQYNNRFTYQSGNPLLEPAFAHNIFLNVNYKDIYASVNYYCNEDVILYFPEHYDKNISKWTYNNYNKYKELYLMLNYIPKWKNYEPTFSIRFSKPFLKWNKENYNTPRFYFSTTHNISLKNDWILGVDMLFQTKGHNLLSLNEPSGYISMSLYKAFFNKNLTFYLTVDDILKTNKYRSVLVTPALNVDTWNYAYSQSISLNILYKFNYTRNKYKGVGAGSSERNRL